jgi:uncharacterized protein GlcG (DUF336 family)
MNLALAEAAVQAARARAKELGTPVTVAVVDAGGRPLLISKGDGTGFLTPDIARAKAVAAAGFRRPTRDLYEHSTKFQLFYNSLAPVLGGEVLPSTGAVPIVVDGRVIGGIGCGGASAAGLERSADQDHDCSSAGAAAVVALIKSQK